MKNFISRRCLAVILLVQAADCFERLDAESRESIEPPESYDYFVFAQMWPQTTCWNENRKWADSGYSCTRCRIPHNGWTIHGFWPSNRRGGHPANCRGGGSFRTAELSFRLRERLAAKWPTYKSHTRLESFWGYEYRKHGSCALDNESLDSASKYFEKTLELLERYDVGKALETSGIRPGGRYSVGEITGALRRAFGTNAYLQCRLNPENQEQYVVQVHVCFDKTFQLVNCANDGYRVSNCRRQKSVMYPENMRSC